MSPNYQKKPSTAFHFIHAGCLSWKLWNACRFFQIMNNRKRKSIRKINHKKKTEIYLDIFFFNQLSFLSRDDAIMILMCTHAHLSVAGRFFVGHVLVCVILIHIFLHFLYFCISVHVCMDACKRFCVRVYTLALLLLLFTR